MADRVESCARYGTVRIGNVDPDPSIRRTRDRQDPRPLAGVAKTRFPLSYAAALATRLSLS